MNAVNVELQGKPIWGFDKTIDNLSDWDKKYNNTFVSVNGKPEFVSVSTGSTCIGDSIYTEHQLQNISLDIKPYFPKNQWVDFKGETLSFLRRVPERQYKRSCNVDCYTIDYPHLNIFNAALNIKQVVKAVQQTEFHSFASLVEQEHCAGVLNSDFSMFKTGKNTFSLVGCNGVVAIGRKDKREVWTFNQTLNIVRDIIGATEEWQINSLGVNTI